MFSCSDDLKAIVNGRMSGDEALKVLRIAIHESTDAAFENGAYSQMIRDAEDRVLYGESGRPSRTFR